MGADDSPSAGKVVGVQLSVSVALTPACGVSAQGAMGRTLEQGPGGPTGHIPAWPLWFLESPSGKPAGPRRLGDHGNWAEQMGADDSPSAGKVVGVQLSVSVALTPACGVNAQGAMGRTLEQGPGGSTGRTPAWPLWVLESPSGKPAGPRRLGDDGNWAEQMGAG